MLSRNCKYFDFTIFTIVKEDFSKNIQNLETQIKRLTNCPRGWNKHGRSCYKLNTQKSTWKTADQFCRRLSGKLAEIGTKDENDFIKNLINNNPGTARAWIGGEDTAEEGTWIWTFSEIPLSFKNWNKGEPNDRKGKEGCLEILGVLNGLWNDLPCSNSSVSVCEKDLYELKALLPGPEWSHGLNLYRKHLHAGIFICTLQVITHKLLRSLPCNNLNSQLWPASSKHRLLCQSKHLVTKWTKHITIISAQLN
ncbi:perlucin-like [Ostrea edulis]|uniref:perlucin-like n=1 Tax=Ostrea edulis TaxID=37623 RepID=UPI0024AF4DAA|nr:perlucin-like [Ostrea edulis]